MVQKQRLILLVIGLLSVGVILLSWFLGVSPQLTRGATLADDRDAVETTNDQLTLRLAQLEADSDNLPAYESELAALQVQVPPTAAQQDFIDQLDRYLATFGVSLDQYTADAPAAYIPATEAATGTQVTEENFLVIGTNLQVRGPYANVTAFITALQSGPDRLYVIDHVVYRPASDSDPNFIAAELTGQVYVLLDSRGVPDTGYCEGTEDDADGCVPAPSADSNPWD